MSAVNDVPATGESLAPYAAHDGQSRGRRYPESPPQFRGEFQRDRDRIIHSNAFRRLVYKTQVFVNHEGDLYRTRVTHSIEVAQIARSVALALRLNEYGGFEHNLQSLRVVDELEERYAQFRGLNLTFECREGILKHCSLRHARELGELGERFIQRRQPGLEAQIANLADEIAYNNHDVDDGIRAQLLDLSALREVRMFRRQYDAVVALYPDLGERRLVHETIRRMINHIVVDFIRTTQTQLTRAQPRSIDEVRAQPLPLAMLSDSCREEHLELKAFLREHVYRHYKVLRMTSKARRVVQQLFEAFFKDVSLMPPEYRDTALQAETAHAAAGRARAVADYIAGMTDRYAILEHRRLFEPAERT